MNPGEKWRYGASTDVVARLVEAISAQPIDKYLSERILRPLGMEDTFYFVPPSKAARRATRYSTDGGKSLTRTPGTAYRDAPPRSRRYLSGVGGLYSTAADYFRFCQMNLNGGEYGGVRILSPKTVQLMTADHTGDLRTSQSAAMGSWFWPGLPSASRHRRRGARGFDRKLWLGWPSWNLLLRRPPGGADWNSHDADLALQPPQDPSPVSDSGDNRDRRILSSQGPLMLGDRTAIVARPRQTPTPVRRQRTKVQPHVSRAVQCLAPAESLHLPF